MACSNTSARSTPTGALNLFRQRSICQAAPTGLYQDLAGHGAREEHLGRFVRVVNDEIIVRSPVDAAQYLLHHVYTPFDAFDQEELYVLTLNTKNRITHETMVYRGTVNSVHIRPGRTIYHSCAGECTRHSDGAPAP